MNQQDEYEEMKRLMDQYERSLQDCSLKEFRELRYKLKQLMEKLRSKNQAGK